MLLRDLFEDSDDMTSQLTNQVIDYLIPMVSRNVEFVSIDEVEETLKKMKSGLDMNRELVMKILDPQKIKLIKKIEDDKIYLINDSIGKSSAKQNEIEAEKRIEHVKKTARDTAKKRLK